LNNLNLPTILPDELGIGYLSFLASINVMSERELIDTARQKSTRERRPTIAEIVADLAGISDRDFICSHSLKPFFGGFEDDPAGYLPYGKNERTRKSTKNIFPQNQKKFFFCAKCAAEDLRFRGRSFWRRSHQIPGACWCLEHKTPLMTCPSSNLSDQPHNLITLAEPCITAPFPKKKTIEGRYLVVIAHLLKLRSPILSSYLRQWLCRMQNERNITCHPDIKEKLLLSDLVLKRCSTNWCQQLFEDFSQKQPRKYFQNIDGYGFHINNHATTYALAVAVLFDNHSDIARVMNLSCVSPANRRKFLY
jgi:hypothetical protein